MKIILPNFTIGIFVAATLLGQTESPPDQQSREAQSAVQLGTPTAIVDAQDGRPDDTIATLSNREEGAELLIRKTADQLAKHSSIVARVRFHVDLFGYQPIGQGLYLQHGISAERKIRWELKTTIGDQIVTWQQVCDGRYLWQLSELSPEERNLERVDLRRVRLALEQSTKPTEASLNFKQSFAIGGLPEVAENLRKSFSFMRAEAGQLDQLPVWIVTGSWRPEALKLVSKELAEQAATGKPLDLKKLPPQLPEEVAVYLGQEDLFPYRIEYRRRGAGQGRAGEGRVDEMKTIVLVELYEVRLGAPIEPRQFEYEPSPSFADTTEIFLKTLTGNEPQRRGEK